MDEIINLLQEIEEKARDNAGFADQMTTLADKAAELHAAAQVHGAITKGQFDDFINHVTTMEEGRLPPHQQDAFDSIQAKLSTLSKLYAALPEEKKTRADSTMPDVIITTYPTQTVHPTTGNIIPANRPEPLDGPSALPATNSPTTDGTAFNPYAGFQDLPGKEGIDQPIGAGTQNTSKGTEPQLSLDVLKSLYNTADAANDIGTQNHYKDQIERKLESASTNEKLTFLEGLDSSNLPLIQLAMQQLNINNPDQRASMVDVITQTSDDDKEKLAKAFAASQNDDLRQFAREITLMRQLDSDQTYSAELEALGFDSWGGGSNLANVIVERAERESGKELRMGATKEYTPESYADEGSIDQQESGAIRRLASAVKAGGISEEEQAILSGIAEIMGTAGVSGDNLSSDESIKDKIGELTALPENTDRKREIEEAIFR